MSLNPFKPMLSKDLQLKADHLESLIIEVVTVINWLDAFKTFASKTQVYTMQGLLDLIVNEMVKSPVRDARFSKNGPHNNVNYGDLASCYNNQRLITMYSNYLDSIKFYLIAMVEYPDTCSPTNDIRILKHTIIEVYPDTWFQGYWYWPTVTWQYWNTVNPYEVLSLR